MFLKHRKLTLWLLCLLSSLLFSLSLAATYKIQNGSPAEATSPQGSTRVTVGPTVGAGIQPSNTLPERETYAELTGAPSSPVNGRPISPYLCACGFFLSAVLAILYLIFRQEMPLAGPEAVLAILNLCVAFLVYQYRSAPILWLCIPVSCCVLAALREMVWWAGSGFPIHWSSSLRLAVLLFKRGGQRWYLLCLTGIAGLSASVLIAFVFSGMPVFWALPGCGALGLAVYVCIRQISVYGKDMEHLTGQVQALFHGQPLAQAGGFFEEQELQLSSLRQQIEDAVEVAVISERFKVELISNVSHDLRTPLTAILGYAELLQKQGLSEEGRLHLQKLTAKAGYMRDLVDTVFDLTKVSSGSIHPNITTIDLIRLLEQTIGLFSDELDSAGLEIRRHYDREDCPVATDGALLHQVMANLLGNAVKYALPGSRVHIHVQSEVENITVRMTNVAAYEMDFQPEQILQRFVRGDKARSTQGSGIGLAIAQTYTQVLGGIFQVKIDGEQFTAIVSLPANERNP